MREQFFKKGWASIPASDDIAAWAAAAKKDADRAVAAPENAHWQQCEGTWFVGVDALPNGATGQVGGAAFPHSVRRALDGLGMPELPFHPAQVSVIYRGYPKPRAGESEAGFRYRLKRDAAHVDGLLPIGPDRRRMLREPHAYILGLPLTECSETAAPLVIWEGSHEVMRAAFLEVLSDLPLDRWPSADLTEVYQAARRRVFESCPRVAVTAAPGAAYVVHRLALHGVAPWGEGAVTPEEGRMIAYFRPEFGAGSREWLLAD